MYSTNNVKGVRGNISNSNTKCIKCRDQRYTEKTSKLFKTIKP